MLDKFSDLSGEALYDRVLLLFAAVREHFLEYESSVLALGHFHYVRLELVEYADSVFVVAVLDETLDDSTRVVSECQLFCFSFITNQ